MILSMHEVVLFEYNNGKLWRFTKLFTIHDLYVGEILNVTRPQFREKVSLI